MAPSQIDDSVVAIENQITRTLAEYIDRAITSPPKHQPSSHENEYDVFFQNRRKHVVGVDMKQAYTSKPGDPSWVNEHGADAINTVRLFLAAGEHDIYASASGPYHPLSLDSVNLKCISQKRFKSILFHIANATERAVGSRTTRDPQACDRVVEECAKKTFNINIHQQYQRRPDDPYWMERYSNMAINIARLSLIVKATPAPRTRGHPRPPVRIQLDSVQLKYITHEEFYERLTGFFEAQQRSLARASSNPAGAPAAASAGQADNANGEDDKDDDDDWEDGDGDGDDGVLPDDVKEYLENLSDYESSNNGLQSEDLSDDETSIFDSDERRDEVFKRWSKNEREESLPLDVVGLLLDDPTTHDITANILMILLGVEKEAPIEELKANVQSILRKFRRIYRIAHTRTFVYDQIPEHKGPVTYFLDGYLTLTTAVYMLRRLPIITDLTDPTILAHTQGGLEEMAMSLRRITKHLLPEARKVMAERGRVARLRMKTCMEILDHRVIIHNCLAGLFTTEGSERMPRFNVNDAKCTELLVALQNFKEFHETTLSSEYFPMFPGCLVKPYQIMNNLREITKLKYISEFRKKEDFIAAANIAVELLLNWHERSHSSMNSLFVPLQY